MKKNLFVAGFKSGFEKFGRSIAAVVNVVILGITYFIGVGISSLLSKLFHKSNLDMKMDKGDVSYWSEFEGGKEDLESHYRQYK